MKTKCRLRNVTVILMKRLNSNMLAIIQISIHNINWQYIICIMKNVYHLWSALAVLKTHLSRKKNKKKKPAAMIWLYTVKQNAPSSGQIYCKNIHRTKVLQFDSARSIFLWTLWCFKHHLYIITVMYGLI